MGREFRLPFKDRHLAFRQINVDKFYHLCSGIRDIYFQYECSVYVYGKN